MIRAPRTNALVAAFAALTLGTGCAGAQARPAAALDATASLEPGRTPDVLPASEGEATLPEEASAPVPPPAPTSAVKVGGARAERRRAQAAPPGDGIERGREPSAGEQVTGVRAQVIEAARRMLGTSPRLDCSGFVLAALGEAGVTVDLRPARSRSESLYRAGRLVSRPSPGDLVFFDRTTDRDRRGRRAERNRFTHVALVEAVDGTALTLIHRGGRRVERIRMDLSRPSDPEANDPVRLRRRRDRPGTRYLSGELFAAFGGLLPDDVTRKLQARRGRDTPARHPASR